MENKVQLNGDSNCVRLSTTGNCVKLGCPTPHAPCECPEGLCDRYLLSFTVTRKDSTGAVICGPSDIVIALARGDTTCNWGFAEAITGSLTDCGLQDCAGVGGGDEAALGLDVTNPPDCYWFATVCTLIFSNQRQIDLARSTGSTPEGAYPNVTADGGVGFDKWEFTNISVTCDDAP